MERTLNLERLTAALTQVGMNQSRLAKELNVSRETASKWLKGKAFPRPDKLLKLALLVGLSFDQLVVSVPTSTEPIVAFRKKGARKTTAVHIARAQDMGRLLAALVPYLSYDDLVKPATLKDPVIEYAYLQRVAARIRAEIGLSPIDVLDFRHLIKKFNELQAVLIPVLWGSKDKHENALHIHLPDSMTTWVYLNLDSEAHDFKFWMAHELSHVYAPSLIADEAEDFADALAGTLLFPIEPAKQTYEELASLPTPGRQMNVIKAKAEEYVISPVTVYTQVNQYAKQNALPAINLGNSIFGAAKNLSKRFHTVSETLFDSGQPTPKKYISIAKELFDSPFFDALRSFLVEYPKSASFIQTILDTPLLDAKGIHAELS